MTLEVTSDRQGVPGNWDWKAAYVERLADGAGYEMFSESSVTPDTMLLLAGPPRIANDGFTEMLSPIGLVTDVNIATDNQLRPIWEIGTDMTYFTRGKATHTMNIGAMVANKPSLMKILSRSSPTADTKTGVIDGIERSEYPEDNFGQMWMNLDSETTSKPFGILVLFKAKGSTKELSKQGGMIGSVYLENCNIGSFNISMNNQAIVLQENLSILFDRVVPVDYS